MDKTLAKTLTEAGVREAVVTAYQAVGGAPYLDNLNTVFGQVYDGMDVVDAIAAVAIGGTSMAGGRGKIVGTFVGVLMFRIISNILTAADVSTFLNGAISAAIIVIAVLLQGFQNHKK